MTQRTLWGRRNAFNVQKVLWLLGELDLAFEHREAGGAAGGLDTPEFLAMNPHGRVPVPVLVDGDLPIWESHSILRYLGARYAAPTLWPEDPAARSNADRWMDWSQTSWQPDFMGVFWGWYRTPEASRDGARVGRTLRACERHLALLDAQLATQPYLAGAAFSLADVPAGTALYRWFEMGLEVPRPPNVVAWYQRLGERTAYQEHVMRPFDELRGRLAF